MKSAAIPEAPPVIIPAYNEAEDLPLTLESLSRSSLEVFPIVIDNGSTDNTAGVAKDFGVEVVSEPVRGKMRATQTGLKFAMERSEGPILFTDADTVLGANWAEAMLAACADIDPLRGGGVFGKGVFTRGPLRSIDCVRSVYSLYRDLRCHVRGATPIARGYNYDLVPDQAGHLVRGILSLPPNLFPGEDTAIRDLIAQAGGETIAAKGLAVIARTKGDRVENAGQAVRIFLGKQQRSTLYEAADDEDFVAYVPGVTIFSATTE